MYEATKHPNTEVDSIRMMGPDDIFNMLKLVMSADPQVLVPSAWDNSLADDGLTKTQSLRIYMAQR